MLNSAPERLYTVLFFAVVAGYCFFYAPFGINETDGGFLTGLGWQVISGKTLYSDILYVRPPLPVWLRALEIALLPESWSVLGERVIFYLKVALYSWLAADLLARHLHRSVLALLGFIVSVHNYPACAWHTTDGILFAVISIWMYAGTPKPVWGRSFFSGAFLVAALLCKQSFYPLAFLLPFIFFIWDHPGKRERLPVFFLGLLTVSFLFISYLYQNELLRAYFQYTGGAASGGQALQHGLLDYFRINPALALFSILFLTPLIRWLWWRKHPTDACWSWNLWLVLLAAHYGWVLWKNQSFQAPFSQARLLFFCALVFAGWQWFQHWKNTKKTGIPRLFIPDSVAKLLLLVGVSWSAAVSWGYNLPILFATPWVFAALEISRLLWEAQDRKPFPRPAYLLCMLVALAMGRFAYSFVYRDGPRSAMTEHLGDVFPRLQGIYSSPEKAALYSDLDELHGRYGDPFTVLPAFPQAHFLTNSYPILPLDWVVERELDGDRSLILKKLQKSKCLILVQNSFLEKIENEDPELEITRVVLENAVLLEETPHFIVLRYE